MNLSCIPIYKPAGIRSTALVSQVKRILNTKKIGHTGTLDSFAEGILLLLIGPATRLSEICMKQKKTYRALIRFGITTDTLDPYGIPRVVPVYPQAHQIFEAVDTLTGVITQRPPIYSALKIDGNRYSDLARKGILIEPVPRNVRIYDAKLLYASHYEAFIELTVSKGTYIRSYARSLAEQWGGVAHVKRLQRVSLGAFHISESYTLQSLEKELEKNTLRKHSLTYLLQNLHITKLLLNPIGEKKALQGAELHQQDIHDPNQFVAQALEKSSSKKLQESIYAVACSRDNSIHILIRFYKGHFRYRRLDIL